MMSLGAGQGGQVIQTCRLQHAKVLELLVRMASLQTAFITLDEEIKMTSRRVNALEYVVIPKIDAIIRFIEQAMDEQEREEFFRVKKIVEKKKEKMAREAADRMAEGGEAGVLAMAVGNEEKVDTAFDDVKKDSELVVGIVSPVAFASHLKWMREKYALRQDMFLIGDPGSMRRRLAYHFCLVEGLQPELLTITRDTVEADLRQRREFGKNGQTIYVDSAVVRAAIMGRVLILDGIEKAERNVLPTINNLLENREMVLDDGRCLVSPTKYDKLAKSLGEVEVAARNLVRVSPRFIVVALGLPVPPCVGHPLDPPLRHFTERLSPSTDVETLFLFKDMSARDLQRRATDAATGETAWLPSAAVRAAVDGKILVLDGLDRVPADVLCALTPLISDRQCPLQNSEPSGPGLLLSDADDPLVSGDDYAVRGRAIKPFTAAGLSDIRKTR
ncbi:von Willebrand factor A domain-containing protein 8 [Perkinsus olseni]|uniref:von Willebrand factor A domain-containing protein 8 n=1 Tax=Perkinsus olseni TaxID=32597 RepID=A0A7J6PLI3_PEROL|nr:von Willebrand factor A domain-containing protein 8 [Perkinsus olseni]